MDAVAGREITRIPLGGAFRARFGNRYAVAHRGHLLGVLLRACRESPLVDLRPGTEVIDYEQGGNSATAILSDGDWLTGRALVGADGLWSCIRSKLVGDGVSRVSGHTAYRSVIPTAAMPKDLRWNAATLWAGPGFHIVHYPLAGSKVFNLVVIRDNGAAEPVAGEPATRDQVRSGLEQASAAPRRIIDSGRGWRRWVLCDREPASTWVDGRVALLGDAAHPMLPYLAQGACMALEDAVCLSAEIGAMSGDVERALPVDGRKRGLRTARVQLQLRAMGDYVYHSAGVHAELRNAVLQTKSVDDWYDALDWLYGAAGLDGAVSRQIPPARGVGWLGHGRGLFRRQ